MRMYYGSKQSVRHDHSKATKLVAALIALAANVLQISATSEDPLHKKLFPSTDEYDGKILDPYTVFGSPYGGFSRATRSRLAAMPLRLPDMATLEEDEDDEADSGVMEGSDVTTYMETSDGYGRGYICRVYHEDSLDPTSLHDSMFDWPKLRDKSAGDGEATSNAIDVEEAADEDENEDEISVEQAKSHDLIMMETHRRLKKLEGVCSQIHLGWWSYEWCFERAVTQFHIHVSDSPSSPALELQDLTNLGKYSKRKFKIIDLNTEENDDEEDDDDFPKVNKYAEDELELAQVVDTYTNGDICDATGKPRETKVRYYCCSDRLMEQYKGPVLHNGSPVTSKVVSVVKLLEDADNLCHYSIAVCTPLLCEDIESDDDDSLLFDASAGSMIKKASSQTKASKGSYRSLSSSKPEKENESIRDILDRTIGKLCLQSSTTGWWSYEYCHRKHVRQFHESITINTETGLATSGTEDIYMLGYYNEELDSFPDDEEWKYVVNVTASGSGSNDKPSSRSGIKSSAKGVAAYFKSEYVGGDVCDDPDVSDSTIKAGSVGGGHAERACSVHYSCGSKFNIYVSEDSTCHYIVEITVPDLCDHPFFKVPIAKKRVVKCLPVEDSGEWDTKKIGNCSAHRWGPTPE